MSLVVMIYCFDVMGGLVALKCCWDVGKDVRWDVCGCGGWILVI